MHLRESPSPAFMPGVCEGKSEPKRAKDQFLLVATDATMGNWVLWLKVCIKAVLFGLF